MTKHSHFPYTSTYSSTPHNTNIKHPSHPLHKHTAYFNTPRIKTLFLTTAATQQTFPQTPTQSLQQTLKQTCAIYIHRLSLGIQQQEAITKYCAHNSSAEEILPRLTRRILAQLRTNKSPFLKLYLHHVDAKSHPSPLCPLCKTHTHTTHTLSLTEPTLLPQDLWTDPDGGISWLVDQKRDDRTPPTNKGQGSG